MTGVNFGHVVFAQVRQLVGNLNKKNFKATSGELTQVPPALANWRAIICTMCVCMHNFSAALERGFRVSSDDGF